MKGVRWESDLRTEKERRARARDLERRAQRAGKPYEGFLYDNVARCAVTPETAERWGKARAANECRKAGVSP